MDRLERNAVLVTFIKRLRDNGSWCGETHVQKGCLFLQDLMKVPLAFDFILYKHGPYSFDLNDELAAMRSYRFVKLVPQPYPYGPSIVPDEVSDVLVRAFGASARAYESQIAFVARWMGNKGVAELERLATAFFLMETGMASGTLEDRAQEIVRIKRHIKPADARQAVFEVEQLKADAQGHIVRGAA